LTVPPQEQEQPGADAVQLGIEESAARFLCPGQGFLDNLQALLGRIPAAIGPHQHAVVQRARKPRPRVPALVLHLLRVIVQGHRHEALAQSHLVPQPGEAPLRGKGHGRLVGFPDPLPVIHQFSQMTGQVDSMGRAQVVPSAVAESNGISRRPSGSVRVSPGPRVRIRR
jgi:hypothetical protein